MSQSTRPPTGAQDRGARRRIVVAEDDPEMRRVVADALRKAGHEVVEASDGGTLSALLARASTQARFPDIALDLIITDIRMPGGNGLDIVETLRATSCRTPVILMTAFGDHETRRRSERIGAILLDKPFRMEALMQAVRAL